VADSSDADSVAIETASSATDCTRDSARVMQKSESCVSEMPRNPEHEMRFLASLAGSRQCVFALAQSAEATPGKPRGREALAASDPSSR
jgi:hypothetical protein